MSLRLSQAALLCLFFTNFSAFASEVDCQPDFTDDAAVIQSIVDGDTLTLQDGRAIRLIGIDAPEIDHQQPDKSEAFAVPAQQLLQRELPEGTAVKLIYGSPQKDRFGRTLVHLFTEQNHSIAQLLLSHGMARQIIYGDNDTGWRCYRVHEESARKQRIGIWQLAQYQPLPAGQVQTETPKPIDIVGTVTQVKEQGGQFLMELDQHLWVAIDADHRGRFSGLLGKDMKFDTVRVRGQPYFAFGKWRVKLQHPAHFERVQATLSPS